VNKKTNIEKGISGRIIILQNYAEILNMIKESRTSQEIYLFLKNKNPNMNIGEAKISKYYKSVFRDTLIKTMAYRQMRQSTTCKIVEALTLQNKNIAEIYEMFRKTSILYLYGYKIYISIDTLKKYLTENRIEFINTTESEQKISVKRKNEDGPISAKNIPDKNKVLSGKIKIEPEVATEDVDNKKEGNNSVLGSTEENNIKNKSLSNEMKNDKYSDIEVTIYDGDDDVINQRLNRVYKEGFVDITEYPASVLFDSYFRLTNNVFIANEKRFFYFDASSNYHKTYEKLSEAKIFKDFDLLAFHFRDTSYIHFKRVYDGNLIAIDTPLVVVEERAKVGLSRGVKNVDALVDKYKIDIKYGIIGVS